MAGAGNRDAREWRVFKGRRAWGDGPDAVRAAGKKRVGKG